MISGLGERIGDKVDPAVVQFRQGPGAAFIARMEMKSVGGRLLQDPLNPTLLSVAVYEVCNWYLYCLFRVQR